MGVSIVQVAQRARVSRMTVTRVMRGDSVREATRKRVLSVMSQLGYVPSLAARAMRSKDSLRSTQASCFALVFGVDTQNADEFFCEVARGVEKRAAEFELCALQVHWLENLESSWGRMQSVFAVDGLCGVILVGQFSVNEVQGISKVQPNIIMVDGPVPGEGLRVGAIESDNIGGCRLALEHLLQQKVRRPVVVTGPKDHYFSKAMMSGVRKYRSKFESVKVIKTDYSSGNAKKVINELLVKKTEFDGVFGNDTVCLGVMRALAEKKIAIPRKVKVIGFDNIPVCEFLKPALTSINIDKQKLGGEAVRMLVDIVRGNDERRDLKTVVNASLIKREST